MIISASRRTDIPAFYAKWFMNRVEEGFLLTRNPMNFNQIRRVNLLPQEVDCIVFWTRNPKPLFEHLDRLDHLGHHYYFLFTITGFPRFLEGNTPETQKAIESFQTLATRLGPERVIWRFDPLFFCKNFGEVEHLEAFSKIAHSLQGYTHQVKISLTHTYGKVEQKLKKRPDIELLHPSRQELLQFGKDMVQIAQEHGIEVVGCAEEFDFKPVGIRPGLCIDPGIIEREFGLQLQLNKDKNQRLACGCVESVDIGTYNTCLHDCLYCYATYQKSTALKAREKHDVNSPFLLGGREEAPASLLFPVDVRPRQEQLKLG